jgi:hypothetical protein
VTYTEDGVSYPFDYTYNALGTVDTLIYPQVLNCARFTLKSVYDAYGYLNQVKDNSTGTPYWTLNAVNDSSLPTSETLGNGVAVATGYTPWTNEMTSRSEGVGGSLTSLQNLSYAWDLSGNLERRVDVRQSNLTEIFTLDAMNRIKTATLNGSQSLSMAYDAAGNIVNKSDVSASNYVYGDAAHPHAVTTAGSWALAYDANGNMSSRAGSALSWYSYNLPNLSTTAAATRSSPTTPTTSAGSRWPTTGGRWRPRITLVGCWRSCSERVRPPNTDTRFRPGQASPYSRGDRTIPVRPTTPLPITWAVRTWCWMPRLRC